MSGSLGTGTGNDQVNDQQTDRSVNSYCDILSRPGIIITGIGSRETPPFDLTLMTRIAEAVEKRGGTGRSGGAGGATLHSNGDFQILPISQFIIRGRGFLPKDMTEDDVTAYLGRKRPSSGPGAPILMGNAIEARAMEMAARYHPAWEKCSQGAKKKKKLHTRNMPQVLGETLNKKASLVVAWTIDGKATGGTGQPLRIAADLGIPIANLKNLDERHQLLFALGIPDPQIEAQKAQMVSGWGL